MPEPRERGARRNASTGVLEGVRVVEVSQLIAAPLCGLTLQDMGAEVVKVEPAEGDYTRTLEPILPSGESGYYRMLNRGKRSVAVDFRSDSARTLADKLVERADIVIENMGDAATGAGFDQQLARQRNPKLIWCSITGFGRGSGGRTLDPALQASMGMMALTGEPERAPMRLPIPLVDFATGMYAVQSILAALLRVERGGDGALLDCAMLDTASTLTASAGVYALGGPAPLRRMGTQNPWYVPAANFEAADGNWVQLIAVNERHWRALCEALARPEWAEDPRMSDNDARVANRELVHEGIAETIRTESAAHWQQAITAAGGFCQRIREIEEAWADPLLARRGLVAEMEGDDGAEHPIPVVSLMREGEGPLAPAAGLGEHNAEVAAELGVELS